MPAVVPPMFDHDDAFFWAGAAEGRLLIKRCLGCDRLRNPPTPMCAECRSVEWDAVESSGRGTVYSWVVSQHPTEPDAAPRVVVLVDLDEGIRLVSNLLDVAPGDVMNGMTVEVCFEQYGDVTLPQFRPVP